MTTETHLSQAMQIVYESVFDEKELPLATGGKDFHTRPDALTDRQIAAIFRYGKRALNDAYNADAKVHRDAGESPPDPQEFFTEWLENLGTNKPRGGGSPLSIETAGWIAYFKSKQSVVRFKNTTPSRNNLTQYQDAFVNKAIWPSVRNAIKDLDKTAQVEFHKTKLPELIAQNKEKVIKLAEDDKTGVGSFIDAERKKRAGAKLDEQFTVDIEVNLS